MNWYVGELDADPLAEVKESFHDWLDNFDAVSDEEVMLDVLSKCCDALPNGWRQMFGLPSQATYADAVELLRSEWNSALEVKSPRTRNT